MRGKYRRAIARALALWDSKPMVRGVDDCPLAIADIDIEVVGIDTAEGYRGKYSTVEGAKQVLGKGGLAVAYAKVMRRLGWPRIPAHEISGALDGDRGIARTHEGGVSVVIRYRGMWVGRQDHGDIMVCDDDVLRAWSVG